MLLRILALALFFNCLNAAMMPFQGAKPPFAEAAMSEIKAGNPVAIATCFVDCGQNSWGSGTFVELDGQAFILTAAHVSSPKYVGFLSHIGSDTTKSKIVEKKASWKKGKKKKTEIKRKSKVKNKDFYQKQSSHVSNQKSLEDIKSELQIFVFDVAKSISKQEATTCFNVSDDIQLLLLDRNPKEYGITPLKLSSDFDNEKDAFAYGFGHLLADFDGKIQRGVPLEKASILKSPSDAKHFGNIPLLSKVKPKETSESRFLSKIRDFCKPILSNFSGRISKLFHVPGIAVSGDKNAELTYWMGHDVSKLETAIGSGFSGGPLVQNGNVVGVISGGNLESISATNVFIQKISLPAYFASLVTYGASLTVSNASLQYWMQMGAFLLGMDTWPLNFILQPVLSYGMGVVISNNVMMGVGAISTAALYAWGYPYYLKNYQWSTYAKITPDLLNWIKKQLNTPSKEAVEVLEGTAAA